MDTYSRRIVGWSIDTLQESQLVINAPDMTISRRTVRTAGMVQAVHGVQFTSWAFNENVLSTGLVLSFGSVGNALYNAMMESFLSSMQKELLDRKHWTTRVQLSNAKFDYTEFYHHRRRDS